MTWVDKRFGEYLKGRVLIVGIGNTFRGDDGAGPALIKRLKSSLRADVLGPEIQIQGLKQKVQQPTLHVGAPKFKAQSLEKNKNSKFAVPDFRLFLMDVGEIPENFLGKMVECKPDTILFVDVADFGVPAGSINLIDAEDLSAGGFSTHSSSISLVIDYLRRETQAKVLLLGIQPERLRMGDGLSESVKKAIQKIEELVLNA